MNILFDGVSPEKPPKKILAKVLEEGRELIGKGEDDWSTSETCRVIQLLPGRWKADFVNYDPVIFKNWMIRLRKDKVVPKVKPTKSFVERVEKLVRDFKRQRERRGDDHLSEDYKNYIVSEEWQAKARQHKERCNHRCQLCGEERALDAHHTKEGYKNLGAEEPWHIIAVCSGRCHAIADALRSGFFESHGKEDDSCFLED